MAECSLWEVTHVVHDIWLVMNGHFERWQLPEIAPDIFSDAMAPSIVQNGAPVKLFLFCVRLCKNHASAHFSGFYPRSIPPASLPGTL
jgi:hypothetical protein